MDTAEGKTMNKGRGTIIIGAILVLLGILWLFDISIGALLGKLWPLALIAVGLYLLIKAKTRDDSAGSGSVDGDSISGIPGLAGDIRVGGLADGIGSIDKSLLFGDIVIDLTDAKLLEGDNFINASLLFGDIVIRYPENFPASADLSCCIGDLNYKQKHVDGFFPKIKDNDVNFDKASQRLIIKCRLCMGDIRITTIS